MSLRKRYQTKTNLCTVTFSLTKAGAGSAQTVHLVGDFNGWNQTSHPLKKQRNGSFAVSLHLERNRQYQFRYLLDGKRWENDWKADQYVANEYSAENSVVIL